MNVVILDTGCANLNSVQSAIMRHGYEPVVSRDPDVVLRADKLFLPGVGTARRRWIRSTSASWLISSKPVLNRCWAFASGCSCLAAAARATVSICWAL